MRIQLDASLQEFRFISAGREMRFRPILWVAGEQVLSVGEPPAGQTDDTGLRIFAQPHPDAMELLSCLIRHGVRGFRRPGFFGGLFVPKLQIRIGRDIHDRLCGFAKDIFSEAAKYSGAVRGVCELAD